jgi:hypothetical protein
MKTLQRLELLKDLVQEAVDRGATSVEQIHQTIADLPFEALERLGALEPEGAELRATKTRTIGLVYDAIRRVNKEVGELLSDQFENLETSEHVAKVMNEKPSDR